MQGTQRCTGGLWGACEGEQLPEAESCDNQDNDCDGATDEELVETCYTGPTGTAGVGECREGVSTCEAGKFSACKDEVLPAAETCGDGKDNDCDGKADEKPPCQCTPGDKQSCGSDVGECAFGTQTCTAAGEWGPCTGETKPAPEDCDNKDNDCDGKTDEALTQSCYGSTAGTEGVGECKAGTQTCSAGDWGNCAGEVKPTAETCDGKDNDCDGKADGFSESCYTGPAGTEGEGLCKAGSRLCSGGGWGSCGGEVLPQVEDCDDQDNDCDGTVDGFSEDCYTGPGGTEGKGDCKGGTRLCTGGAWGSCEGQVLPESEVCDDQDNDCDGTPDDGLPVYTHYYDTDNDGYGGPGDPTATSCKEQINGFWTRETGDCHYSDKFVHPGQTGYFELGYTTVGGSLSFDYDCSGTEDKKYPDMVLCQPTANCANATINSEGWAGAVPACGDGGDWATDACTPVIDVATMAVIDCTYSVQTQKVQWCR